MKLNICIVKSMCLHTSITLMIMMRMKEITFIGIEMKESIAKAI
ncbi:unknown protein [Cronobacter turicensis z3032]|uniref:Uncharacterized protein n=1 Tax=Cronobacter turicensis (strain DSM 18703 / CCUG 55852 / LMG 23827 / z3032) TaxID=693216 RepID=C9Y1S8_CROTZ|nr:unknown protein [Cronobacter turicensis z3032]